MKRVLTILFLVYLSYPINGQTIEKERPEDLMYLSAPDSTGYRRPLKTPIIHDTKRKVVNNLSELPYPIIFIHGLNSEAEAWNDFTNALEEEYGMIFGGRKDYCLNFDNDNSIANTNFYPENGADIAIFVGPTINFSGDYFYLNFNIGIDGSVYPWYLDSSNVLSNQAAVVKQSVALKNMIQYILNGTGKSKVILFGHSMGGLAAREYLQNPSIWQDDGQHHVAKLITTGTPHGGSNTSGSALSLGLGINEKSDAVRDLRTTYSVSGNPGVYLNGGFEDLDWMDDSLIPFYAFHNTDVNCNTINDEFITGLNSKENPNDLDFACIIGSFLGGSSDGVVNQVSANLFNYIDFNSNTVNNIFNTNSFHTSLQGKFLENMQGLDEPNEYELSYEIELNKNYSGFVTPQPINGYDYDYDDFKFTLEENGVYELKITSTILSELNYYLLDSELNILFSGTIDQEPINEDSIQISLNSGQYFLEFKASPNEMSPPKSYNFSIETNLSIPNNVTETQISVYPNPTNSIINIDSKIKFDQAQIYSVLGQKIFSKKLDLNQIIDLSELSAGFYNLILKNSDQIQSVKILKE